MTPSRTPVSTSTGLTHSLSVCNTPPIFGAMDSKATHSEGYSPQCSCTMRTARSRTSGENLFDFFIAQSSQRFEPPQNTGLFEQDASHKIEAWRSFYNEEKSHSALDWQSTNEFALNNGSKPCIENNKKLDF